ncbi:MAG: DNA polymerase III subunit delta' [Proteobacteria bacterium]|nr:DNA polymerase III subunit delta' [Pseudomonadota bacterium]HQR02511.1 DNA polymerase III subunit delta' [Rhodocyclaceae bacterium]
MSVKKILPWLLPTWDALLASPQHLPHALLLAGPGGLGKSAFAEALASRLLCEDPAGSYACGRCEACHWFALGNHPDFRKLTFEREDEEGVGDESDRSGTAKAARKTPSTQIRIDQVRALEDFVFVGSHRNGSRVIIIDPADAMNMAAVNALLKILEEPPPSVYFLIVSSKWRALLPTLLSRCRKVLFDRPDPHIAENWLREQGVKLAAQELALVGGLPLRALSAETTGTPDSTTKFLAPLTKIPIDALSVAAQWSTQLGAEKTSGLEALVDAVQKWVCDLNRCRHGVMPRYLTDHANSLGKTAARANPARLMRCHEDLLKIRATCRHPLNTQLFLEEIAYRLAAATAPIQA